VGSEGFDLHLWNLKSGNEIRQLPSEPAYRGWLSDFSRDQHIDVLAFSPDGKFLVGGGRDDRDRNWLDIWDVAGNRRTRLLENQDGGVNAVAFSADGGMLASAGQSNLNVWQMPVAKPLPRHFRAWSDRRVGLDSALSSVAFAADARTLCLGTEAGTIHLWDIEPARERYPLEGHTAPVTRIAFSPDGQSLATMSRDASTRVWNWRTGKQVRQFPCNALGLGAPRFPHMGKTY
jgi:WD40 repeat protein